MPDRNIPVMGAIGNLQFPAVIQYGIYFSICVLIVFSFRYPGEWIYKSLLSLLLIFAILSDFNKFHPLQLHVLSFLFIPRNISARELGISTRAILGITIIFIAVNQINGDYFLPMESILSGSGVSMWVIQGVSVVFIGIQIISGVALFLFKPIVKPTLIINTLLFVCFALFMLVQKIYILNALWFFWLALIPFTLFFYQEIDERPTLSSFTFLVPALILCICLLSYLGVINRIYSFNIFVKHKSAILLVDSDVLDSIPEPYHSHVFYFNGGQDPYVDLDVLMAKEFNLLLFPSDQVILRSVSPLRNLQVKNEQLVLLIKNGPEMEIGKDLMGYFKSDFK